ncbi:MAG TPA: hypothetical protein VFQ48_07645 [Pseudonocardiaceae bacterium]|nr:hypothetical protein [Pseudonocardiaceae bacterium]
MTVRPIKGALSHFFAVTWVAVVTLINAQCGGRSARGFAAGASGGSTLRPAVAASLAEGGV